MADLLCSACGSERIAAPDGSTPATVFTCKRCCDRKMRARNGEARRNRRAAHAWRTYQNPPLVPKEIIQANSRADSIPTAP